MQDGASMETNHLGINVPLGSYVEGNRVEIKIEGLDGWHSGTVTNKNVETEKTTVVVETDDGREVPINDKNKIRASVNIA